MNDEGRMNKFFDTPEEDRRYSFLRYETIGKREDDIFIGESPRPRFKIVGDLLERVYPYEKDGAGHAVVNPEYFKAPLQATFQSKKELDHFIEVTERIEGIKIKEKYYE